MTKAAAATLAATRGIPDAPRRLPDVEWLRVCGMLLVFTLHVAEPFNPWDAWHIVNPVRSKVLGELVFFLAPWIMPLFMMLAGESACHALARRSAREFVRERLLRLGLPLVAGLLVVVPPQVYVERRVRGEFSGSLLDFYPHFFTDGFYPRGNLSWHHLWFLVFLLVFSLAALPLFAWLRGPSGRRLMCRLGALCAARSGLVWLVLPALCARLGLEVLFARIQPIAYDWSNRGLLLPAFVFGYMLDAEPGFRRGVDRHWRIALGLALAASAALLAWAWPGHVLDRLPEPVSAAGVLLWSGDAGAAWCWLVALLGAARRFLTRRGPGLERASEVIYPFYVLHHLVIIVLAAGVVRWDAGVAPKFAVLGLASLVVTVALCAVVESVGPLRVLFGLRRA